MNTKTNSRSNRQIKAIRWYAKKYKLSLTPNGKTPDNNLVYYKTRAGLLFIKHIEDVVTAYEAAQLAGVAA